MPIHRNPNTRTVYRFPKHAKRYVNTVQFMNRTAGHSYPCWHGHFDCAAWEDGPCEHEVAVTYGVDEDEEV